MQQLQCHFLFLSSHDPFYNLSFENYLLRNCSENIFYVLLWQNSPSVILGNFQNPWREVNFDFLAKNNIQLVRRQSGGGTVYHDLGNLNFSFIAHKSHYNEKLQFSFVIESLKALGFDCEVGDRKEINVNHQRSKYKITGSAFKRTKNIYLQHGTLLFNANLQILNKVLIPLNLDIQSKAVDSVRSKVINLCDIKDIEMFNFQIELVNNLNKYFSEFKILDPADFNIQFVEQESLKLKSFENIFGRTPKFEINLNGNLFSVKNGFVHSVSNLEFQNLIGKKFHLNLMS